MTDNIRGYRVLGEAPKVRELSTGYLQQSRDSSVLLKELWDRAPKEGANCVGREDEFSGDDLPTDREAQLLCSGCPLLSLCREYAESAHPAWGLFGGRVYGRNLEEAMKDDEEDTQ